MANEKSLGLMELVAIALGGMVGGGIFSILGISVSMIGAYTPTAIVAGGVIAFFAAYSYVKLGVYYKDEGATYAFYKLTFPHSEFRSSLIGWWVIFGYISTLSLYSYTFASYALSSSSYADSEWARKALAGGLLFLFTVINLWSVKGMGKLEDIMVYSKLVILIVISFTLANHSKVSLPTLISSEKDFHLLSILIVSSVTFVAYEGFQLVINAVNEMENPDKNIPRAIYTAIFLAVLIYLIISIGAIVAIPFQEIIENKEYALASGAEHVLGHLGAELVILGAVLATCSAVSGTLFGSSRQLAEVARDGYFPKIIAKKHREIPVYSIIFMSSLAFILIALGSLEMVLEFGSITFLIVSLLMAFANFKMRQKTRSHGLLSLIGILVLFLSTALILYYDFTTKREQFFFILILYAILTIGAWYFARRNKHS